MSIDVERGKVLLIRSRKTGEYLLPKGRKDLGEPLEQPALRETFEETGVRVALLCPPPPSRRVPPRPSTRNLRDVNVRLP